MSTKTIRPGLTAAMTVGRALHAAGWRYDSTTEAADDWTERLLLHPSGREITATTRGDGESTTLTMTGLTLEQAASAVTGAGLAGPVETPEPTHTPGRVFNTRFHITSDGLVAMDAPKQPQTREIKARYLTAGMVFPDGATVAAVHRPADDDLVHVHFDGVPNPDVYHVEEAVTVVGEQPADPDDYWLALADDVRQAADRLATLAGTPKPESGARLSFYCGLSPRRHERTRPVVDAIAAAFGVAAHEKNKGGGAWHYEADAKVGDLDLWAYTYTPGPEDPEKAAMEARIAELEAQLAQGGEPQ